MKENYPETYRPKPVVEQLEILTSIYTGFGFDASKVESIAKNMKIPRGAELLQVVPKLSAFAKAKIIGDPYHQGGEYCQCLLELMKTMDKYRGEKFDCQIIMDLFNDQIFMRDSAKYPLIALEKETPGDYLVIPMQSGRLYRGIPEKKVFLRIQSRSQWLLPLWIICHHLLVHPKRFSSANDLAIRCLGDQYIDSDNVSVSGGNPYIHWYTYSRFHDLILKDDYLEIVAFRVLDDEGGVATGFNPASE